MAYYFKASLQMDGEHIAEITISRIRSYNKSLKEESGLNYILKSVNLGQNGCNDFEQNFITIVITFKQLPQC